MAMYLGTKRNPKNLIPFPYKDDTITKSGITWTVNADGTITANGTATANTTFSLFAPQKILEDNKTYCLSGKPILDKVFMYITFLKDGTWYKERYDNGNGVQFTAEENCTSFLTIQINAGTNVENVTFKPMLNEGTKAEPYTVGQAVKIIERSKNLIPFPYEDTHVQNGGTRFGVTYTINDDGTVILNGTDTGEGNWYTLSTNIPMQGGKTYTISGSYGSTIWSMWRVIVECKNADGTHLGSFASTDGAFTFTAPTGTAIGKAYIYAGVGQTFNNQVFKPMLNEGEPAPYGKKDSNIFFRIRSGVNKGRNPKNLIPFPYYHKSHTKNGVTFTVNDDGTVTINGTPTTATSFEFFVKTVSLKANTTYSLSGASEILNIDGKKCYLSLSLFENGGVKYHYDKGNGNVFTCGEDCVCSLTLWMGAGTTVDDFTIKPMLNEGTKALPYFLYD